MPAIDKNKPFSLDKEGGLVISDPIDEILKAPAKSPTNVEGVTPEQAAEGTLPAPKIEQKTIVPTVTKPDTIVPVETKPRVLEPDEITGLNAAFARKQAGTANKADLDSLDYAQRNNLWSPTGEAGVTEDEVSDGDIAAKSFLDVADDGVADVVDETAPTDEKWTVPSIDNILGGFGIEKITAKDYSADFKALEENLDARLEEIDLQFQVEYDDQVDKNKNITSALQAKLIKAGVRTTGTSYISAVAGQEERNSDALKKIENNRDQQKASARQGKEQNFLTLSATERNDYFNTATANIDNVLQGYNVATNVWQSFNARSEFEKTIEQDAQQHLENLNLEWYKLDQDARSDQLNQLNSFIEKGLYDVYDENVANMLHTIEKNNGLETGSLVNAAVGSYWDRMSNIALKDAQAESMLASAEESKALLPLKVQKYQADIRNVQSTIAKRLADSKQSDSQESNSLLEGSAKKLLAEAKGTEDEYYDSSKYVKTMNEFVTEMDPDLKNEKYYQDLFMNYLPPTKLLNPSEEDKAAVKLRSEFNKSLSIEDLFGV